MELLIPGWDWINVNDMNTIGCIGIIAVAFWFIVCRGKELVKRPKE